MSSRIMNAGKLKGGKILSKEKYEHYFLMSSDLQWGVKVGSIWVMKLSSSIEETFITYHIHVHKCVIVFMSGLGLPDENNNIWRNVSWI